MHMIFLVFFTKQVDDEQKNILHLATKMARNQLRSSLAKYQRLYKLSQPEFVLVMVHESIQAEDKEMHVAQLYPRCSYQHSFE
jgi:hypothetical protein